MRKGRVQFHLDKMALSGRGRLAKLSSSSYLGFSTPSQIPIPLSEITRVGSCVAHQISSRSSGGVDLVVTIIVLSSVYSIIFCTSPVITSKLVNINVTVSALMEQSGKRKREDTSAVPSQEQLLLVLEDYLAEHARKNHCSSTSEWNWIKGFRPKALC